jgi:hypothetical protein
MRGEDGHPVMYRDVHHKGYPYRAAFALHVTVIWEEIHNLFRELSREEWLIKSCESV